MSLDVMAAVQKGDMKNTECILCGECCSTCSTGVLRREFGSSWARFTIDNKESMKL